VIQSLLALEALPDIRSHPNGAVPFFTPYGAPRRAAKLDSPQCTGSPHFQAGQPLAHTIETLSSFAGRTSPSPRVFSVLHRETTIVP